MQSRLALILLAASTVAVPLLLAPTATAAPLGAPQARAGHSPTSGSLRLTDPLREVRGGTLQTSSNWAGYDVTGGDFTSVAAAWTQPAVQPDPLQETAVTFWVGLDGDGSSTSEQCGTWAVSVNGVVSYSAWYDVSPAPKVTVPLTVNPGDEIAAAVASDGNGSFGIVINDETTGGTYSTTQYSAAAQDYSAEIIAGAPTNAATGNLYPLANFGTVQFTGLIDQEPISSVNWNRIDMVSSSGATLATTSALASDGETFSISTGTAPATDTTPPPTTVSGADSLWHNQPVTLTFTATDDPGGSGWPTASTRSMAAQPGLKGTRSPSPPRPTTPTTASIRSATARSTRPATRRLRRPAR